MASRSRQRYLWNSLCAAAFETLALCRLEKATSAASTTENNAGREQSNARQNTEANGAHVNIYV
jgi:hypothetical protein